MWRERKLEWIERKVFLRKSKVMSLKRRIVGSTGTHRVAVEKEGTVKHVCSHRGKKTCSTVKRKKQQSKEILHSLARTRI